MPTHFPSGELYFDGVWSRVDGSIDASRFFEARYSSGGEFSVKKTSAGEREPSVTIWSANTSSSS